MTMTTKARTAARPANPTKRGAGLGSGTSREIAARTAGSSVQAAHRWSTREAPARRRRWRSRSESLRSGLTPLPFELAAQGMAGAGEAPFDGSGRNAQPCGDLAHGIAVHVMQ